MKKILFLFFSAIVCFFYFSCSSMKLYVEDTDCTIIQKITQKDGFLLKKEYTLGNYKLLSRGKDQTNEKDGFLIAGNGKYTTTNILRGQLFKDDQKIMDTSYIRTVDSKQKEIIIKIREDYIRNFIQIGLDNQIEINEIVDYKTDLYVNNFLSSPNLLLKIKPLTYYITEDEKIYDFREIIGAQFFINNQEFAVMNFFMNKNEVSLNEEVLNSLSEDQKDYLYAIIINFYIYYKNNKESGSTISSSDYEGDNFSNLY